MEFLPVIVIKIYFHDKKENSWSKLTGMFNWRRWGYIASIIRLVRDSSAVRQHYIFLLEPWDVGELYIRKTADLPLRLLVSTFPCFVAIGFYFLSETLI
jgi:hypothetical protein